MASYVLNFATGELETAPTPYLECPACNESIDLDIEEPIAEQGIFVTIDDVVFHEVCWEAFVLDSEYTVVV